MNNLPLSADETIFYSYNTARDELTVQLEEHVGPTEGEPSPDLPLVELRRSTHDGAVVALRLKSVQEWLLHSLVRDLVTLLKEARRAEDAAPAPEEAPAAPAAVVEETADGPEAVVEKAPSAAPEPAAEDAPAPEPEPVAEEKPKRTRRRKKAEPEPELAPAAEVAPAAPAAPAEAAPEPVTEEKPKRTRRRKKAEPEPEVEAFAAESAAPAALVAEVEAAEPVAEEKPKRTRRRKKAEPEPEAMPEAEPVAEEPPAAPEPVAEERPKRTRRRKKAEPEAEVAPEPEPPVTEEKPRRTPRRKKAEPKAEVSPEASAEEAPTAAQEAEAVAEEAPSAEPDAATEGGAPEAAAEEGVAEGDEAPAKRKRRRRRRGGRGTAAQSAEEVAADVIAEESAEEGEEESADEATPTAAEGGESASKRKRRRRRGGRGRQEETTTPATQPAEQPQPEPPARAGRGEGDGPEEESRSRRAYKTAPIPGLGAPEGFAFLNMNPLLGQALMAMGFEEPTPIQRRAVPVGIEGRDVIGLAQTGTGKTVAFLIPALHRLLAKPMKDHRPRLLVLTPTRELALQVAEEAEYLATHTDLLVTTIYGGVGYKRQLAELKEGTDIVIATPGRLLDLVNRGAVKLNSISTLVLDEADRMLDMGFLPEIRQILARVPKERQTLLFSATMPPQIQSLSLDFQRDPVVVEVARQLPPASIEQFFYPVERHLKTPLLAHMLESDPAMTSVLVFTETKADADIVTRKLKEAQVSVAVMHGDRNQREREQALQSLRDGSARVLVATDVAARGLDITGISHVVNYHVPQSVDDYVHRIGRTARGEATGRAYTFLSSGDEAMASRIEGALDRAIERKRAEGFNYDVETPSWAKPSAANLIDQINKPKNLADRFRRMNPRRR